MEERDVIKSSIQNKMEYFNRYCKIGNIVLLNNEAECNQWPMARMATKKDDKGDV